MKLNFHTKVVVQKLLSVLPGGRSVYLWLLDHVVGTSLPSQQAVQQKVDIGLQYWHALANETELFDLGHMDIGAGWQLTIPFLYYQMGCDRQVLTDIQRAAHKETVFHVVELMQKCNLGDSIMRPLPATAGHDLDSYLELLGITYDPNVLDKLPVADNTISLVTCTQTLLYIPKNVVRKIFEEVARVLRPGGYFIATIHTYDLYSIMDPKISRFNFLRYSSKVWDFWFNSSMMSYNRMRPSDYLKLFSGLPFEPIVWDATEPSEQDYAELARVPVNSEFSGYLLKDVASPHLTFVMRRV